MDGSNYLDASRQSLRGSEQSGPVGHCGEAMVLTVVVFLVIAGIVILGQVGFQFSVPMDLAAVGP
jgi:hypothetical protein